MDPFAPSVKTPLAAALDQVSIRTLLTIAAYHGRPASRRAERCDVHGRVLAALTAPTLGAHLLAILTHHDLALFAQLVAGYPSSLAPADVCYPWTLTATRPALDTLRPLERLMALGLLLPVYRRAVPTLLLPAELIPLLEALGRLPQPVPRDLPAVPLPAALLDDAVTLLAALAVAPAPHLTAGDLPAPLLRHVQEQCGGAELTSADQRVRLHRLHALLHQAGLLTRTAGGCTASAAVPAFLTRPPTDQLHTLLRAWATQPLLIGEWPTPLVPADVDAPALCAWLAARLTEILSGSVRLADLLAAWATAWGPLLRPPILIRPPAADPLPPACADRLLAGLLRGPLHQLGFVQSVGPWIAPTAAGLAWLRTGTGLPPPAAPVAAELTLCVPAVHAGSLRFGLAAWATTGAPQAQVYTYTFTAPSLRAGCATHGSPGPLRALLRAADIALPTALRALLAQAARPPPVRLLPATILQVDSPAILTDLLARRPARRHLGARLGPQAALVRDAPRLRRFLERQGLLPAEPGGAGLAGPPPLPPLLAPAEIATDSAATLLLALRLAERAAPAYAALFARLAGPLARSLPPARRADLDDLWLAWETPGPAEEPLAPDAAPPASPLDPAGLQRSLETALEEGRIVSIRYYTAGRGVIGWRRIRPLVIRAPYLTAFCLTTQQERTFRLDRILALAADPHPRPAGPLDQV